MLHPWLRTCRRLRYPRNRPLCSSSVANSQHQNSVECTKDTNSISPIVHVTSQGLSPISSKGYTSRLSLLAAVSAASVSAAAVSYYLLYDDKDNADSGTSSSRGQLYSAIEHTIDRSKESAQRIINRMKHTGVAASVLWQSLRSVFSSANHGVRSGFEFRVASFLADIAAVNANRRAAIVVAGDGKVVDWLLETVAVAGEGSGTQAEAARALAYLIADPIVRNEVFARPHAVPYLLRSIFSSQPHHRTKKNSRRASLTILDSLNGRSMLITAIMDVVTSNCDSLDNALLHPSLPEHAEMSDIAAAIQVIEGGMTVEDPQSNDDDDGGNGLKGIGIKVLGDTTVVGLSRNSAIVEHTSSGYKEPREYIPSNYLYQSRNESFLSETSTVVPGLWDDLHTQHVAVPFAAWALANWALASEENRIHIQELDSDGHVVTTALAAPERSVKWHGSLVARLLLEDKSLELNDSICDWSTSLLSTISQACRDEDIPLAQVALTTFLLSVEKSAGAKKVIMDKGLPMMRRTAKLTTKHKNIQEALAKALELICAGEMHLSLEESQRWSGILLPWACGRSSSEGIQLPARNILSRVLEDYGPSTVPISMGWLTIILSEVLSSTKTRSQKGKIHPKTDEVKTQVNQSNISSAAQITNQLASAVVNLAGNRLETAIESADSFPFEDLLSQEPFVEPFKSLKKQRNSKFHVADYAVVTLKGIKALAEVCTDDPLCQNIAADSGVLSLLRRFLLRDDYEKLAAMEAYDASRARETQDQASNAPNDTKVAGAEDSVRIPPTAHIRRHAARLLTILSALPKVQNVIREDAIWCLWLEECANGRIPGCHDLKIQSYARAILLNVLCNGKDESGSGNGDDSVGSMTSHSYNIPRYDDMIFLINPGSPHWKCPDTCSSNVVERSYKGDDDIVEEKNGQSEHGTNAEEDPLLDVVFVHGLRGGPFKSWRISEDKSSTKSGLVEKIDQEAGKQGTFWPGEWLSADFPHARLFSLKYKSSLTQWSGASLPLQEVSSMLLEKLIAAGIGSRPVVFVTHSMGGLVVKQMLHQAREQNLDHLVNSTAGVVFYSCPHFGSRLADMPWRMGLVLRPAPTIGELRSGSPRLVELNEFIRQRHKRGFLNVLSFCETKVTPIVEGYGGWAFRMEIVPIESAYPGYGDIVLESTDHINSCKPLSKDDPSYTEILDFLRKLKAQYT
ncbi:hypothetical protein V2J09_007531 [Rumex salicifolius]